MDEKDWLHNYYQGLAMGFECKDCSDAAGIMESFQQQLQQAHRQGWEQAKREAYSLSQQHSLLSSTKSGEIEINELAIAIAAMEYKESDHEM